MKLIGPKVELLSELDITNIANDFTHLNLWQVVRLKMLYNDMRPRLNGKKY